MPDSKQVLLIDDEQAVRIAISQTLQLEDFDVTEFATAQGVIEQLSLDWSGVIVSDINLPGKSGLEILQAMRGRGDMRPVLMLTARAELDDKIAGLDAGADDYLSKPFEMQEFNARIRALSRRVTDTPKPARQIGSLHFDTGARMISGPDGPLDIPRREIALFERLLQAEGRLVSKQALLDSLYGTGADVDEPVVEVYVSRLRKRVQNHGVKITVKRGLGYMMTNVP